MDIVEPGYAQKIADRLDSANFFKNNRSKSDFVAQLRDKNNFDQYGLFSYENAYMGVDFYFDSHKKLGMLVQKSKHSLSESQVATVNAQLEELAA